MELDLGRVAEIEEVEEEVARFETAATVDFKLETQVLSLIGEVELEDD